MKQVDQNALKATIAIVSEQKAHDPLLPLAHSLKQRATVPFAEANGEKNLKIFRKPRVRTRGGGHGNQSARGFIWETDFLSLLDFFFFFSLQGGDGSLWDSIKQSFKAEDDLSACCL